MDTVSFMVQKELCAECCLALQRFIGKIAGVEFISVVDGKIKIVFDKEKIAESELVSMVKDSMNKLG